MRGIALYEEDELMRALLEEWLREAGYCVEAEATAGSGCAAGADLVIVSICSPKHEGALVLQRIQAAHPHTPVIALSGHFFCDLSSAGATAQTLGVAQIIAKPLTRDALLSAVQAMIGPPN